VEKSGGRLSFSPQKIKLPQERKKKKKNTRHKTKNFINPTKFFWSSGSFSLTRTVERNPPRLNLNRELTTSVSTA